MPLLSILIPTIEARRKTFYTSIMDEVNRQRQAGGYEELVEVIALYDSRYMILGEKRNWLLKMAHGDFIVFFDDDDRIAADYLISVILPLQQHPETDVLVYDQLCSINGGAPYLCKYGLLLGKEGGPGQDGIWYGKPAHTMPWKRSIAQQRDFSFEQCGEDMSWVSQVTELAKTEVRIDNVLYYYDFNAETSATRGN